VTPIDRTEREAHIGAFLAEAGWGAAQRGLLAGDASFRRYDRLKRGAETAVLMDAPPPMENVGPFLTVAKLLGGLGFSTPRILAEDHARGLLLLEDLGDSTYTTLLRQGHDERGLYELATDALIEVRRRVPASALDTLAVFDEARCLREVSLLLDWYWPAIKGVNAPDAVRAEFESAWRATLPGMWRAGRTATLFDFHVDNLLVLPGRSGFQACGLLDFQDAVAGPVPFDLASLLEDVRRHVPQGAGGCHDRALSQGQPGPEGGGLPLRLRGRRGAAQHPHRRGLYPVVEARQQAELPALHAAGVGIAGAGHCPSGDGRGETMVR
jgi:aminoglycoside/choline kinase family phosphotransferase